MSDDSIAIHLRDLAEPLVTAWRREFAGVARVTVSCGDIFSDRAGPIGPDDAVDVKADTIVSPANGFGFMDGGIDALYTYQLGAQVQENLRARLARDLG